jgi:hypothetical protein
VKLGVGKTVWDALQHQMFLGDEAFVAWHQAIYNAQANAGVKSCILHIFFFKLLLFYSYLV